MSRGRIAAPFLSCACRSTTHAARWIACQQRRGVLNSSLTSSTPPRDPGTDQTEQHTRDDHGDREPNKGESQTLQIGHSTVPPCVIEGHRQSRYNYAAGPANRP